MPVPRACLPVREPALLEDGDIDAGGRQHIRRRAPQRTAADDGDFDLEVAAMPWIRRTTGRGKAVQPEARVVVGLRQGGDILVDSGRKSRQSSRRPGLRLTAESNSQAGWTAVKMLSEQSHRENHHRADHVVPEKRDLGTARTPRPPQATYPPSGRRRRRCRSRGASGSRA